MNTEELYQEMATRDSHLAHFQEPEHKDYEVVVDDGSEEPRVVKGVRWDYGFGRMVIELA